MLNYVSQLQYIAKNKKKYTAILMNMYVYGLIILIKFPLCKYVLCYNS